MMAPAACKDSILLLRIRREVLDQGAGMAHAPLSWGMLANYQCNDGLLQAGAAQMFRRLLLFGSADLADRHHSLSFPICEEQIEAVDKTRAVNRISPNADRRRLAKPAICQLAHDLAGQGRRPRHDADNAAARSIGRHHADLAHARRQYILRIRTYETSSRPSQCIANANHIDDRIRSVTTTTSGISASMASIMALAAWSGGTKITLAFAPVARMRLGHAVEDGNVKVRFPALAWRDAGDDPRTELNHAVRVIVPAHPVRLDTTALSAD